MLLTPAIRRYVPPALLRSIQRVVLREEMRDQLAEVMRTYLATFIDRTLGAEHRPNFHQAPVQTKA